MNKLLKVTFIMFLFTLYLTNVSAYESYFEGRNDLINVDYSRSKAKKIVKSVAELYLYKQNNTDYEQKNQDIYAIEYYKEDEKSENYKSKLIIDPGSTYLKNTFSYRNLNMNPFDLSRSNENVFDCSSFVSNVYLNAFGFNFSDYFDVSPLEKKDANDNYKFPDITKVKLNHIVSDVEGHSIKFRTYDYVPETFYTSGKAVSTLRLQAIQNLIAAAPNKTGSSGNKLYAKELVNWDSIKDLYVYVLDKTDSRIKKPEITLAEMRNIADKLQTGDILLTRRSDGHGHVMLYVEDHITMNGTETAVSGGFIHSTGKDIKADKLLYSNTKNFFKEMENEFYKTHSATEEFDINKEVYGIDDYSVRYINYEKYITNHFSTGNTDKYINYVAIIRPLNVILNGKYTNAYTGEKGGKLSKDNFVVKTTKNIKNLSENLSNVSMQQYLYNSTQKEYITDTNVVNNGDLISVKTYLKNKGTSEKKITVRMPYPSKGYINKNYSCKGYFAKDGKLIKISGCDNMRVDISDTDNYIDFKIRLGSAESVYFYYTFNYKNTVSQEKISIPGMKLYDGNAEGDNYIQFSDLNFTGDVNKLTRDTMTVNAITSRLNERYQKVENNKKIAINREESLLKTYKCVYDMDLSADFGSLDNSAYQTVKHIVTNLFETGSDTKDSYKKMENGAYYKPKNENLAKYVVKGMYGGTIVRGNLDGNRSNQLTFEKLEPGDIIVAYNGYRIDKKNKSNEIHSFMLMYAGRSTTSSNDPIVYFKQKNIIISTKRALLLLKRAQASEIYVVLRPSQNMNPNPANGEACINEARDQANPILNSSNNFSAKLLSNTTFDFDDEEELYDEDAAMDETEVLNLNGFIPSPSHFHLVFNPSEGDDENTDNVSENDDDSETILTVNYEDDEGDSDPIPPAQVVSSANTGMNRNIIIIVLGIISILVGCVLIKKYKSNE